MSEPSNTTKERRTTSQTTQTLNTSQNLLPEIPSGLVQTCLDYKKRCLRLGTWLGCHRERQGFGGLWDAERSGCRQADFDQIFQCSRAVPAKPVIQFIGMMASASMINAVSQGLAWALRWKSMQGRARVSAGCSQKGTGSVGRTTLSTGLCFRGTSGARNHLASSSASLNSSLNLARLQYSWWFEKQTKKL